MLIDNYELIPDAWGYRGQINNILIQNYVNKYRLTACVRYNCMVVYWMWVPFGDYRYADAAIADAVAALQEKFGPDLPVHNNYADLRALTPRPTTPYVPNARERKIYGDIFDRPTE